MKRIIYFVAGITPTVDEAAEIAKFNAAAAQPYEVIVASAVVNSTCGETNRIIPGDFLAGSYPSNYVDEGEPVYPVLDPDSIPVQSLTATQAIVESGVEFANKIVTVNGGANETYDVTFDVVNNVITAIHLTV